MHSGHSTPISAAFGTWKSPITAARIASEVTRIAEIAASPNAVYWIANRPGDNGRHILVRWTPHGETVDLVCDPYDVATTVHEYGGGAFTIADDVVVFSNASDQRLYRVSDSESPTPITEERQWRFADGHFDRMRQRVVLVRERHDEGVPPTNEIVAVDVLGRSTPRVLVGGAGFYAAPRISPDGARLAWLSWNHPSMPWVGSELWRADIADDGSITAPVKVAGGDAISVCQPAWSPAGVLHFVADTSGWWNLYRLTNHGIEPLAPRAAEFAQAQWEFGLSNYAFLSEYRLLCSYAIQGIWRLAVLDASNGALRDLQIPFTDVTHVCAHGSKSVVLAASAGEPFAVVLIDVDGGTQQSLARSFDAPDWQPYYSAGTPLDFPSGDRTAHAFFFAPHNPRFLKRSGELPPLVVWCHGGPAYASSLALDVRVQFWTSTGFAVLLVNYAGSSNYGRDYRQLLEGRWGQLDLEDVTAAVRFVVDRGMIDPDRVVIAGQSAGGYLTLCALGWTDMFRAGTSYFGVADLHRMRLSSHKFESHYIERLVGAPPDDVEAYRRRSPLPALEKIRTPVLLFQGADDQIAPPEQLRHIMRALACSGAPTIGLLVSDERHGFQNGEHVRRALEAESLLYAMAVLDEPLPL